MKIAISTHDYPHYISGPNIWLDRITSFFQEKGFEPVVLFSRGKLSEEYRTVTALRNKGVSVYAYEGADYTEKTIEWILEILNKEKPDIFIPNFDIASMFASKWLKEAGIPSIGAIRSNDEQYIARMEIFVRDHNGFTLDAMVCVSEYLEKIAKSWAHDTVIRRIPSGTPFPDLRAKLSNDKMRLIYTGRISEKQKRISETTHAMLEAVKSVPGTEAVLYGAGSAIKAVEEIIDQGPDGALISYGGVLDKVQVQDELLKSHVFVLLSDYEGLPTALMEAMACGLVPICLDIDSGVPELIDHGENGFLVNDREEDFVKAVNRLKTEEGLWEKLSAAARQRIEENYSIEYSFNKWLELIEEVLEKKKTEKSEVKIPQKMNLPSVHSALKNGDRRWPGITYHWLRMIKSFVRRIASKTKHGTLNMLKR